jgi:hypothetical protein
VICFTRDSRVVLTFCCTAQYSCSHVLFHGAVLVFSRFVAWRSTRVLKFCFMAQYSCSHVLFHDAVLVFSRFVARRSTRVLKVLLHGAVLVLSRFVVRRSTRVLTFCCTGQYSGYYILVRSIVLVLISFKQWTFALFKWELNWIGPQSCLFEERRKRETSSWSAHPLILVIITGETVGTDEEEDLEEPKLQFLFISQ